MSWNDFSSPESLTNISTLCTSSDLNAFVYFVDHVIIKQQLTISQESAINSFGREMLRFVQKHGIKLIKPLKRLLIRLLQRSIGYSPIFSSFLQICSHLNVPAQALEILEYPTFYKGGKSVNFLGLLLVGCDIYIKLRKYTKAYELASKGVSLFIQSFNPYLLQISKRYIVLSVTLFKPTIHMFQISQLLDRERIKLDQQSPKKYEEQLNFYLQLKEWRTLNEAETLILHADNLLEAFQAGEHAKLSCYIQNQIKNQNWRIKAENIRDISIGDFSIISKLNSSKSIFRYDCRQKIMYFNHSLCDQDKINELITKSFIMQKQLRNLKQAPMVEQSRMMGGIGMRDLMGGKRSGGGPGGFHGMGGMGMGMGRSMFDRRF